MVQELKFYFDVDRKGNLSGTTNLENLLSRLADQYAGQMITITVRGTPRDEKAIRGWYFGGIVPDILGIMKIHGTPVDPRSKDDRDWLHEQLKRKFLPALINERGEYIDARGRPSVLPVFTTKNLGRMGWTDYTRAILDAIESTYGVILKPKSHYQNGKKENH